MGSAIRTCSKSSFPASADARSPNHDHVHLLCQFSNDTRAMSQENRSRGDEVVVGFCGLHLAQNVKQGGCGGIEVLFLVRDRLPQDALSSSCLFWLEDAAQGASSQAKNER
jgi:hypothetical protein